MPDGSFIDLNDASLQPPDLPLHDLDDLKRRLADRAAEIYPRLFPRGRLSSDHRELRMANTRGDAPSGEGSCVVELYGEYAGCIRDWSTDERGDQLDAIGYATGLEGRALFEYAANLVGTTPSKPNGRVNGHANGHDEAATDAIKTAHLVEDIKARCVPLAGTLGERYFQARGLNLPESEDIRFHPDLTEWTGANVGYSWPGIVSIIRKPVTGEETGGIHRILLADDGSGKAPIERPKRCLGPSKGVIKLAEMADDGTLGIAEGVETALAAMTIFGVPAWSGVSASGVRDFAFPPGLKKLFVFADRGEAGKNAAEAVRCRAIKADIEAIIVWPMSDDDFAEDLKRGYCAQDYQLEAGDGANLPAAEIIPPPRTEADLIEAARSLDRSDAPELEHILRGCVGLDPLAQQRVLAVVKKQTSVALGILKEQVKRYRNELATQKRTAADDAVKRLKIGSDIEIAERVASDLNEEFGKIIHADGDFWRYSGSHWEAIDEPHARQAVHKYDGAVYFKPSGTQVVVQLSKAHVDSVLHEMSAKLAQPEFFAEAPAGINCATGFIAFDQYGRPNLLPHDPEHRCRHALPGRWHPGVTDPENPPPHSLLGRLLDGVFKGDADAVQKRKLLAEVAGAAAVGYGPKLRQPKAIVLEGETAENGKSQILDTIRGLLPSSAVASVSASKFGDERFIVGLRGKLLNATDELSEGAIASEAFKAAITGNPVSGRDVYRSAITFRPVAQHIFAVNRLPKFSGGMDRGVQRRLLPITFNRVIPAEERVEDIGQRVAQEESDLLLAFAVAGAERLIRQRGFTVPESSKTALQQWIYRDNPVIAWVKARVNPAPPPEPGQKMLAIKSSYAHSLFRDWAVAAGFDARMLPDVNGFVQRLKENQIVKGIEVKHTRTGNWLVGLEILTKDHSPEEDGITEMNPLGGYDLNQTRR